MLHGQLTRLSSSRRFGFHILYHRLQQQNTPCLHANSIQHGVRSYHYITRDLQSASSAITKRDKTRWELNSNNLRTAQKSSSDGMVRNLSVHEASPPEGHNDWDNDVQECLGILGIADTSNALTELRFYGRASKLADFSLYVLVRLLDRRTFTSRSLQLAFEVADMELGKQIDNQAGRLKIVLSIFERLLAIARNVWPVAIIRITAMMLRHLPSPSSSPVTETDYIIYQRLTRSINLALQFVSMPTALEPYKDAAYQEEAIVLILRYMAEHVPTLQLNRKGYRAVIALQLTFAKTVDERRWAELKALSWPPWKVDRTQMDSTVTPEMGVTRAGVTLRRMREAGYGAQLWERTAQLYTGWDVDGTPTIQTRVLMNMSLSEESNAALWVARITTTRTIQEAWAAWLAYEQEVNGLLDQQVLEAIIQKLHLEAQRQEREAIEATVEPHPTSGKPGRNLNNNPRLLPGDRPSVTPLPPSSHLYTYTRTPPPTLTDFYRDLQRRNVILGTRCLAFLVAHASSLSQGIAYLRDAQSNGQQVKGLFSNSPSATQLAKVSPHLFGAFVRLLCRFPREPLHEVLEWPYIPSVYPVGNLEINQNLALGFAIHLASLPAYPSRVAVKLILEALSKEATARIMTSLVHLGKDRRSSSKRSASLCYDLTRQILRTFDVKQYDLDKDGFSHFCRILENSLFAKWESSVSDDRLIEPEKNPSYKIKSPSGDAIQHLQTLFERLTGGLVLDDLSSTGLYNPGPKVWHDLIRVIGLSGDHLRLLRVVQHMCKAEGGLKESIQRDRNGARMVENASIAVRVFLEHSWLSDLPDHVNPKRQPQSGPQLEIRQQIENLLTLSEVMIWPTDAQVKQYWQANQRLTRIRDVCINLEIPSIP